MKNIIKSLKNYLEFRRFNKRVLLAHNLTPSYVRYNKYLIKEWSRIGSAMLNCGEHKAKQILPLKSLTIESVMSSHKIYVNFDKTELIDVLDNKVNNDISVFLGKYYNCESNKLKKQFYFSNKETLILLLDAIVSNYYINNHQEVIAIIDFLNYEFDNFNTGNYDDSELKYRIGIELEFIKRRKELNSLFK